MERSNRRIMFAWERGGGQGHLVRIREACRPLLLHHEFEILVAVKDLRTAILVLGDLVRAHHNLRLIQAPSVPSINVKQKRAVTLSDILMNLGYADIPSTTDTVLRWQQLVHRFSPHVIVSDYSPTLNLAVLGRIPVIAFGTGFAIPPAEKLFQSLLPWEKTIPSASMESEAQLLDTFSCIRNRIGLRSVASISALMRGDSQFICNVAELDPYYSDRKDLIHVPFNLLNNVVSQAPEAKNKTCIYLYLPTTANRLRDRLELIVPLLQGGSNVTAYFNRSGVRTEEENAGNEKLHLLSEPADLPTILARTDLFINYGSLGSVLAGALNGVPQLWLPESLEHRINAFNAEQLGIGRLLSKQGELTAYIRDEENISYLREAACTYGASLQSRILTSDSAEQFERFILKYLEESY